MTPQLETLSFMVMASYLVLRQEENDLFYEELEETKGIIRIRI